MSRPKQSIPTLRRNKTKGGPGRAFVQVDGNRVYLGKWDTKATKTAYAKFVAEWVASDGCTPIQPNFSNSGIMLVELIVRYNKFAKRYYVKNGKQTDTVSEVKSAMKPARELYGSEPACELTPVRLKAVRQVMLDSGTLSRTSINKRIDIIRRMFKWGVAEGVVPETVYRALMCVDGLKAGRTKAREPEPVLPVADDLVEATLKRLPPVVADMVRIQRLTGARPGEVVIMKPADIDTSGEVWAYVPSSHKTEHRNKSRTIYIGPQAQAILAGYLMDREPDAYVFSPAESERLRSIDRRRERQTPVQPSQQNRRAKKPKRSPRDHYDVNAYRRAIRRACDKPKKLDRWSPNQLRHAAATALRGRFDLETARTVLGHAKADMTAIYAETDCKKASDAMRELG